MTVLENLRCWTEAGWFRPLDLALAEFLAAFPPQRLRDDRILYVAVLVSVQLGRGHVCVDLGRFCENPGGVLGEAPEFVTEEGRDPSQTHSPLRVLSELGPSDWYGILEADERCVTGAGDGGNAPLLREGLRVYLRRYGRMEAVLESELVARAAARQTWCESPAAVAAMPRLLRVLFPQTNEGQAGMDWQQFACALVARQRFGIITGGPGTGKTTTVVRLLAALQALQALHQPHPLRIRLAAPTGKAAARLNESIAGALNRLPLEALYEVMRVGQGETLGAFEPWEVDHFRASIPTKVTTLHRLLGSRPESRKFRHDRFNPLAADIVVVDEASMVDLSLMHALVEALAPNTALILLGDKDQLASVDAGAVLGELCQRAERGYYLADTALDMAMLGAPLTDETLLHAQGQPIDQCIAMLRQSHRFDEKSGIGQLAAAVNRGDTVTAETIAFTPHFADIRCIPVAGLQDQGLVSDRLTAWLIDGETNPENPFKGRGHITYLKVMADSPHRQAPPEVWQHWAARVLKAFSSFQVLCATREGRLGVQGINERLAGSLLARGFISRRDGWYPGRPVLMTRNDYSLGLMNGDIGITLSLPAPGREGGAQFILRVAFPSGDGSGGVRWVLPSRLQDVETVYAMTVHKSQGSEFEHACLILPEQMNPVVTRELIYTAITRAKVNFSLVAGSHEVFLEGIRKRVVRASGLGRRLGLEIADV